jgi:hypothetical protein
MWSSVNGWLWQKAGELVGMLIPGPAACTAPSCSCHMIAAQPASRKRSLRCARASGKLGMIHKLQLLTVADPSVLFICQPLVIEAILQVQGKSRMAFEQRQLTDAVSLRADTKFRHRQAASIVKPDVARTCVTYRICDIVRKRRSDGGWCCLLGCSALAFCALTGSFGPRWCRFAVSHVFNICVVRPLVSH